MPYIGRELERGTYLKLDDISSSFDGNKTIFNLTKGGDPFFPGSPQSIIVSVNGTILEPVTEYGIDSSKIVFATAPANGHAFFSITLGLPFGVFDNGSIEDGSLTGFKLSNPFNYDGGLLFLNSLTDKVGIRTENPTHDLDVHGDVRIVGILTVGTSSLILDGSNNKIQVGTALTLSHNDGAQIGKSHLHSTGYDLKDNAKIKFGDSGDLEIYHNNESIISHSGAGVFKIQGNGSNNTFLRAKNAQNSITLVPDGEVILHNNGTPRFETTTTGATVSGKLVVTGDLDVQGTTTTLDTILTEVDKLEVGADNTTVGVAITQSGTGDALTIDDGNTRVFTVKDGGKIGIGTNNPLTGLDIYATPIESATINTTNSTQLGLWVRAKNPSNTTGNIYTGITLGEGRAGLYAYDAGGGAAHGMGFWTGSNSGVDERLRIKHDGKVGIATNSPKTLLNVYNGTPSDTGGILVQNVSYSSNQDKPYLIVGTKDWTGAETNWNTFGFQHKIKSDHNGVPRLTIDSLSGGAVHELYSFVAGRLGIGVTNPSGKLHLPDSGELRLGNDGDLKIFHNGSLGVIGNVTGDLYIQSNQDGDVGGDIYIRAKAGENSILCEDDGAVYLYSDNAPKFRTYSEGIQVIGAEGGNAAILIKADEGDDNNDMYRIIAGNGTSLFLQNYATGAWVSNLVATGNGSVDIRHAGTKRLETTNTGVDITDNLKVAGISTFTGNIDANGDIIGDNQTAITGILRVSGSATNSMALQNVQYVGRSANRYESSFLDLNDQNIPKFGSGGNFTTLASLSGLNFIFDTNNNDNNGLVIGSGSTNTSLMATHMVVSHQGRVGIGSTIPTSKLDVIGDINTNSNLYVDGNLDVDGTAHLDNVDIDGLTNITAGAFNSNVTVGGRSFTANIDIISTSLRGGVVVRNANDFRTDVNLYSAGFMVYDPYDSASTTFAFRAAEGATLSDTFWVKTNGDAYFNGNVGIGVSNSSEKLEVVGSTTLKGDVNVGDGTAQSRILIKKADNNLSDHIQFFNGTTKVGEIGCGDTTWLRINQGVAKNIYTPRYIRADGGFFVNDTTKGINGSGNFIGGTIAGASDYDTLLRSDTGDTMDGVLTVGGSSVSANEGGQINLTQAPNSTLDGSTIAIDQYIDRLRFFEQGGNNRGASINFDRITGNPTSNEIFSSGLTGVDYTVTHLRSFNLPNGVVAISTSTQAHIPLTVTNSGGHSSSTIIAKFVGDSDGLEIRNTAAGDYQIRNSQQNNGIEIFDGTGGVNINFNNSRKLTVQSGGTKLNDELTFENDDEGVTTFGGGRFYKKNGGGIAIRQSSGNQTPIIESNNGTLQGTILHTGFNGTITGNMKFSSIALELSGHSFNAYFDSSTRRNYIHLYPQSSSDRGTSASTTDIRAWTGSTYKVLQIKGDADPTWDGDKIIHAGNASTELTQFLRSDANDTFTGTLTAGQNGKIAFPDNTTVPDNPTNQQHDYITFGANGSISQISGRVGLLISSSDDSLVLANGDVGRAFTNSHINVDAEDVFILSDGQFIVKTDLQEGFGTEHTLTFSNSGVLTAPEFSGSGSAITNVNAAKVVVSNESSDTTCHPLFATTNTGNAEVKVGSNLSFNSSTGALTATSFVGTRTGNQITDTGNRSTSGYVEAGRGGGGIALTINDGYGNANICFNHRSGVPEQNGASGRIEVNTDSTTANNAFMKLQLASAVTAGQSVNPTDVLNIMSNGTAAPFRLGLMTTSPEATFHIQSNHNASDVPTMKLSEFRPSIHFEDISTSATDWQILCDHNDISNSLQFRSGDSSSQNKLTHLEYYMDYNGFHIGNSDGDRQRKLILHAGTSGVSDTATLYASNGNLHIDCASGHHTYINHYNGNEVRLNYGGSGNSGLRLKTQSTGVQVTGQLDLGGNMQFTAANPELEFNNGGPRFRVPAANTLTVHTGGTLGSTNEEVIRVTSSGCEITGKLGINVAASEANLHIDASAGGPGILVSNAGSTEGDLAVDSDEQIQIGHWNKSTNTYTNRLNVNAAGTIFRIIPAETRIADGTAASPAINFNSDQDTGFFRPTTNAFSIATEGNEVFRLDDDKRLAIGDFSDGVVNDRNAMLYVKADSTRKGMAVRTAGSGTDVVELWSNKVNGSDGTDDDSVHLMAFRVGAGSGLKGSIFYNESTGLTQFSQGSSDRRLKENIVGIDNAIDVIKQLKPCNFNFNKLYYNNNDIKHSRAKTVSGFIADEVETLIPQAVIGTKDAVYTEDDVDTGIKKGDIMSQQMDMTKMIPHLTKALQEAITKIETLEAEVTALKAKVG